MSLIQQITIPLIAVNDTVVTIIELLHENGDLIKKGDTVMILETSKTTYNLEAEAGGYIEYRCKAG